MKNEEDTGRVTLYPALAFNSIYMPSNCIGHINDIPQGPFALTIMGPALFNTT